MDVVLVNEATLLADVIGNASVRDLCHWPVACQVAPQLCHVKPD